MPLSTRERALGACALLLLAAPVARASNMNFRLERSFTTVPGFENCYIPAVPDHFALEDTADSASPNPCVPTTAPDGIVNADDILCNWWTSRQGSMVISRRDEANERWLSRTAWKDDSTGGVYFAGDWLEPLGPGEAYALSVTAPASGPVENDVIIVGNHDPARPCQPVALGASGGNTLVLVDLPYHMMFRSADETLCGLRDLDWLDADGDGAPDTCPNGIFDDVSGTRMRVSTFDNIPDGGPTDNMKVSRSVVRDTSGALVFTGLDFMLNPGDAVIAEFGAGHSGTLACIPHF